MMTSMVAMVTRPKAAATRTTPAMLVRAVGMGMLPLQGVEVGMGMGFSPPGPAHPPDEISEPEPDKEPGRDLAPGRLHALELGHGAAQAAAQEAEDDRAQDVPQPGQEGDDQGLGQARAPGPAADDEGEGGV